MTSFLHSLFQLQLVSWVLYLLGFAGFLAGLYFALWPIWIALKRTQLRRSGSSGEELSTWNRVLAYVFTTQKIANRGAGIIVTLLCVSSFGLGCMVGWGSHQVAQSTHTDTWSPVHILAKLPDNTYRAVVNDDTETTTFKLCPDSSYAQFEPGSNLRFMTFERRANCLSFQGNQLGWRSVWMNDGKPLITEVLEHERH